MARVSRNRRQNELDAQHFMIAAKLCIPVAIFVLWTLAMLFVLWSVGSVEDWKNDTVRYSHRDQVKVAWSRGGSRYYDAMVTTDGRKFVVRDAEKVLSKLHAGEVCEIVYLDAFFQAMYIRGLSTEEDGELVSQAEFIAVHKENQRDVLILIAGAAVAALVAMALIWLFGCRKQKIQIRRIKGEMAKLAAREERRRIYKESKRAGE